MNSVFIPNGQYFNSAMGSLMHSQLGKIAVEKMRKIVIKIDIRIDLRKMLLYKKGGKIIDRRKFL